MLPIKTSLCKTGIVSSSQYPITVKKIKDRLGTTSYWSADYFNSFC